MAKMETRKLYISPPEKRPHGYWFISGPGDGEDGDEGGRRCGTGLRFWQALGRYMVKPGVPQLPLRNCWPSSTRNSDQESMGTVLCLTI